jgi:hypothetical protein
MLLHRFEVVPAHMRDLQRRIGGRDLDHLAGYPAKARPFFLLDAALRHQLAADADAEEGLAARDDLLVQALDHSGKRVESTPAIGKGAEHRGGRSGRLIGGRSDRM